MLPQYLYRGDKDKENKRQLKSTINGGFLLTNLCGDGNGRDIFNNTFERLINKHVSIGWDKTHFLSFTTNKDTAFYYGSGDKEYYPVCPDEQWDFAVFTLKTSLFDNIFQIENGIYQIEYPPACTEFLPTYKVILIDVLAYLQNAATNSNIDLSDAISKAKKDTEWLILPTSPLRGTNEFTAKFDTYCISEKNVFRYY